MQTMVSSHVWQRRTNKIIAMATIIIGLTMMISTIPQCIYIGLIFIMLSLGWLAWMRMKERKTEPPAPAPHQPHGTVSPVLFLVASQNFTQRQCIPTPADPNDKPPSYEQIIKLDGLPPDYFTILSAKPPRYTLFLEDFVCPPGRSTYCRKKRDGHNSLSAKWFHSSFGRYEDIEGGEKAWSLAIPIDKDGAMGCLPKVHSYSSGSSSGGCSGAAHGPLTPLTLEVPAFGHTSGSPSPEGVVKSYEFHQAQADAFDQKPANESSAQDR